MTGSIQLVETALPTTLRRLCVFEDFDENLAPAVADGLGDFFFDHTGRYRLKQTAIGGAFPMRSLTLDYLSVSYVINAQDFFNACRPDWVWHNLQTLALTTQLFQIGRAHV